MNFTAMVILDAIVRDPEALRQVWKQSLTHLVHLSNHIQATVECSCNGGKDATKSESHVRYTSLSRQLCSKVAALS